MKMFLTSTALTLISVVAQAAPISDGSIYLETFTAYPEDSKSQNFPVSTVSGGAVHISTVRPNEGVFRIAPVTLPSEYVMEFDWTANGPLGDGFYMLYNEGTGPPWFASVSLRGVESGPSNWQFTIEHGTPSAFTNSPVLNYDQTYHITLHGKPGATKPVDLYLDGALVGTFTSRNPSLTPTLIQFGDVSSTDGYGDVTIDNISIGAPIPEPSTLLLAALSGLVCVGVRRRRSIQQ